MKQMKSVKIKNYPYDKISKYVIWFNRNRHLYSDKDWHISISFSYNTKQIKENAIYKIHCYDMTLQDAILDAANYGFKINKAGVVYDVEPDHIINGTELGLL